MSEDYDIKKSEDTIGQLYPVLLAKDGSIIDGHHRGGGWKTETLEHVDTEEKKILATAISNWHRREVPREQKAFWINGLGKLYQEEGLSVGIPGTKNEIKEKVMRRMGISADVYKGHASQEFKQEAVGATLPKRDERTALEQLEAQKSRIEDRMSREGESANQFIDRLKEEIIEDKKEQIKEEVEQEIKEEIGFKYDIPELLEPPIDEIMDHQEIERLGKEIGEAMVEPLTELDEAVRKAKPKQRELNNLFYLKKLLSQVERGVIYNPFNKNARLLWSTAHTLGDTITEMEKITND